jgi:hypothetical protein
MTPEQDAKRQRDAQSVKDMVENHHGWQVFIDAVGRREEQVLERITRGELCHDEYRSYTGELKGLRRIGTEVSRLIGKAQEGPESE